MPNLNAIYSRFKEIQAFSKFQNRPVSQESTQLNIVYFKENKIKNSWKNT